MPNADGVHLKPYNTVALVVGGGVNQDANAHMVVQVTMATCILGTHREALGVDESSIFRQSGGSSGHVINDPVDVVVIIDCLSKLADLILLVSQLAHNVASFIFVHEEIVRGILDGLSSKVLSEVFGGILNTTKRLLQGKQAGV